ncbi:kinase-like protein [Meira miltonrushii]|uniref:Kinase-like protein n=1 Tax=Meira miltonrushii TaxID=1280837 RepID=A0A316V967_9BASI|nr:kinase-like protein [Meira miltonrushii]PWN33011.1 kinase-like protein [Meira miltonrushii]
MPLEQIGAKLQFFGKPKSSILSSLTDNEIEDGERDQAYEIDQEIEPDEQKAEEQEGDHRRDSIQLSQNEDMTLLKLGGVGGVQRSGSWGFDSRSNNNRSKFRNSLSDSPEDGDHKQELTQSPYAEKEPSPPSIPWRRSSNSTNDDSNRSSEPGRTSTSSSSAAAFSLRSLSNRHSTSSNGSSAGSSMRHLTSDEGHTSSTSTIGGHSSSTVTSEDAAVSSISSEKTVTETGLGIQSGEDDYSQIGPRVQRIQSIGRGFDIRKRREAEGLGRRGSLLAGNADEMDVDSRDTTVQGTAASDQTIEMEANATADDTIASLTRSPTNLQNQTEPLSQSPKPVGQSEDYKSRLSTLTLTAAAQSERSPEDSPKFPPPEPRRHTGSYALRSRSALSQSVGSSSGLQFGNGQGRAAARKELAAARIAAANSALDTPRASVVHITGAADEVPLVHPQPRSSPANVTSWQSTATAFSNLSQGESLPTISPRTQPMELSISAITTGSDRVPTQRSPIAHASPDALSLLQQPLSSPRVRSPLTPSGSEGNIPTSPFELEMDRLSRESALTALLEPSQHLGRRSSGEPNINAEGVDRVSSRPMIARSSTSLAGMNVLRTPTTEEWSRYLAKQGLDPTLMSLAAANAASKSNANLAENIHLRSRTNTSRSAVSGNPKRRISDREFGMTPASMSSSVEALPHENILNQPNDLILAEMIRQSSNRQPRSSSAVESGRDELDSVKEDESDEEFDVEDARERLSQAGEGSESDEELSDDMAERMRALHEAISRPPSRRGTPAPSESGRDVQETVDLRRNLRWPTRDMAAELAGYPLPPQGEQRNIQDFVIVDDIGRGAYGLVKKARVRDEKSGEPIGPEFAIKYIIKSRILADCWRRHKALGPIPVEIHVLDQLRRLAYPLPVDVPAWSAEKLFGCKSLISHPTMVKTEEGECVVTVGHPSLCMMVDFFEDHEFYYMVMPRFGTGQDLFDYVESQPHGLTTRHVRCIFGQLADGLRFLHANNIVHRDVKDENVILDGNGHIQLIDFGSAAHIHTRSTGSAAAANRLFDTFSGTLDYAAAEILRGEKYGGKEQDVWALGVVGYVLLCGDCPFWNGEEAMEGLQEGTRAYTVLTDRRRPLSKAEAIEEINLHAGQDPTLVAGERDAFSGRPIVDVTEHTLTEEKVILRRQEDIHGQSDGGGKLDDAADLILQCLSLDPCLRPTMDQICSHKFLLGDSGWFGQQGWRNQAS